MRTEESRIDLPERPAELAEASVAAWHEAVVIDTYVPEQPDRYPAFLDRRVYQGSSGRVYPLPFYERISRTKHPQAWDAVHLENDLVRLMILPALGGRIHIGLDKTTGYDFFYRNEVIKPALIGLTGPWIAGGVEFNWPQHHRPATYLPTNVLIEHGADGSVTAWCSDHDPFTRMKGMHGVCLRPDSSLVELKVRLYNRTDEPQTFLWWANVAARANEDYQSFFPTDVTVVADHAKRAVSAFPHADRPYYGIDYSTRSDGGRDRIDWYRNIPVPTSYMCMNSADDFFGGYDHGARAGFVHVADHQVSVGKKMWTWGNEEFGRAWCRNLTDDGSVYIELMAGVFTDNQPDFSFLAPGETKVFSQYWYPINEIGPVQQATTDGALRVAQTADGIQVGVASTTERWGVALLLRSPSWSSEVMIDVAPGRPAIVDVAVPAREREDLEVVVRDQTKDLVTWRRRTPTEASAPASEPAPPSEIDSVEELYLVGLHLQQYRHATRSPEPYWHEALRRDPGHAPTCVALAGRRLRASRYGEAERLLRTAVARLTTLNPNPADCTALYRLGLVQLRAGRADEAYDAFGKASWDRAWRSPAGFQMALIDAAAGRSASALERLEDVLRTEPEHLQAAALRVVMLRRLGRHSEAQQVLVASLALDPLHWWMRHLAGEPLATDPQTCLDVALEYVRSGEPDAALDALQQAWDAEVDPATGAPATRPLVAYYQAQILARLGRTAEAATAADLGSTTSADWCFPGRLDDADLLRSMTDERPNDPRPYALLGMWLYAHDRAEEAVAAWRSAVQLDPDDAVSWRNLGLAAYNHGQDLAEAVRCYDQALLAAPNDGRLIFERDQLDVRAGVAAMQRLERLTEKWSAISDRDDAAVELAHLYLSTAKIDQAAELLQGRTFQPWEGGEGQALRAWDRMCLAQARRAMAGGEPDAAVSWLDRALDPPQSLGEQRHPLANSALLDLVRGDALAQAGKVEQARQSWSRAASQVGDFLLMSTTSFSENTFASVLACRRLGQDDAVLVAGLARYCDELGSTPASIDYFATSLPSLLLFTEDPELTKATRVRYLRAQMDLLNGDAESALARRAAILADNPHHVDATDLPALAELTAAGGQS